MTGGMTILVNFNKESLLDSFENMERVSFTRDQDAIGTVVKVMTHSTFETCTIDFLLLN